MQDNESSENRPNVDAVTGRPAAVAAETPQPSAALPAAASLPALEAKSWAARGRQWAGALSKFIGDVGRYYWGMRGPLWEFVAGHAPNLMSESLRMREVRLAPYESHALAEFDDADGWKVSVPGRCVVCGEPTANPPGDENLSIDDAARSFWVPVGTALFGAALSMVFWNRRILLVAILLGPVLGYLLRGKMAVRMRVARCDPHLNRTSIPQVLVWGKTLVLRFGHKLLRKIFLYGERMGAAVSAATTLIAGTVPSDPSAPGAAPVAASHPQTIPLADSPAPEDATITHDRPPQFETDKDLPSPLVP